MATIIGPRSDNFRFFMPGQLFFGSGLSAQAGAKARELGMQKVLVVTDSGIARTESLLVIMDSLSTASLNGAVWSEVVPDPTDVSIDQGVEVFRSGGYDGLIGLGGGSAIDTAKAIGAVVANCADGVVDLRDKPQAIRSMLPLVAVPTTSGTGSEVTNMAVFTQVSNGFKGGLSNILLRPGVALVDPELTVSMPRTTTIGTGVDALAHAVESYVTKADNPFSDALALYAIELVVAALPVAAEDGEDIEARGSMSLAAAMAGASFSMSGLSANHGISHALGERYHLHHGLACGVALAAVLEYNIEVRQAKIARLAPVLGVDVQNLGEREAALAATAAIHRFVKGLGVYDMVREHIGGPIDINGVAERSMGQISMRNNVRPVDMAACVGILERAFAEL